MVLGHDGSNRFNYASAVLIHSKNLAVLVVTYRAGRYPDRGCAAAMKALLVRAAGKR